jgi:predicted esterase
LVSLLTLSSVIAVHGLGGDKYDTWKDDGKIWLREFLPAKVPNARIMTYGYNSVVAFSKSVTEIEDFAVDLLNRLDGERGTPQERARPVIFICHSLGGIVVKKVRLFSIVTTYVLTILSRHSYLPMSGQTIMAICSKRFGVLSSWGPHTADQTVLTGLTFLLAHSIQPNLGPALT